MLNEQLALSAFVRSGADFAVNSCCATIHTVRPARRGWPDEKISEIRLKAEAVTPDTWTVQVLYVKLCLVLRESYVPNENVNEKTRDIVR